MRLDRPTMCGVDVDLDDEGVQDECEVEEVTHDAMHLLAPPPAECNGTVWGSRRGYGVCVLCGLLLVLWNAGVGVACVTLLFVVFMLVLTPPILLLYTGFLCHTRVLASPSPLCSYLDDNSCSALIILGFVMVSPLVMVAAATFCSLLRRFHILQLFQPISTAQYRGRGFSWRQDVHAWV
ncbi:transmembrane protein 88 isoform X1 [Tachysurus fulvidraco]|uniref:transmembrane protein 88 isoform X1 n=2 Tax=Tachysurus fulvidraco TaxID=1234273 RepID=UPI001FED9D6C|nr:transmembrane protein 88 isoform X1 [Tachysurus fulvidraco]